MKVDHFPSWPGALIAVLPVGREGPFNPWTLAPRHVLAVSSPAQGGAGRYDSMNARTRRVRPFLSSFLFLFLPTVHPCMHIVCLSCWPLSTLKETRHLGIPSLKNQAARHATSSSQHRNAKSKGISLHLDMLSVAKLNRPVYAFA